MVDPDLITRAVKAGLAPVPCSVCRDGASGYCECARCMPDASAMCVACGGTGLDTSPRGLRAAVEAWWMGDANAALHPRITVTLTGYLMDDHFRRFTEPHTGTPESIATAALEAFCRAMGASDVNP